MPLRVAVICATNRRNTGMLTVDLAAEQFFARPGVEATLFRSHVPGGHSATRFAGQEFVHYHDQEQLSGFDRVVFWGDFQNSLPYGCHNFASLDRRFGPQVPADESFDRWRTLFLLEGYRRPAGQRIVSVSNNFQGVAEAAKGLSAAMARRVSELYASSFDAIFPRDAESLRDLVSFAPSAAGGRVEAGLDGAFLLAPAGFVSRGVSTRPSPLRYFFGRSGFTGTNRLLLKAGLALRRPPRQMPGWLDVRPEHNGRTYIACQFDRIRGAAAVLTDTYHLCVNALNLGVPVVGIGKPAARQITAAGDFKKSVLFDSLGLRDFYVDRTALDVEARKRIVAALKAASRGAPAWELAMGRLAEMRHLYRTRLEAEIF